MPGISKTCVLFVCLGNICRSPLAEAIFIHLVKQKGVSHQFFVDSAGTGNWHVGEKADSRARKVGKKHRVDVRSIARQLCRDDFKKFDYIIVMDKNNRSDLMTLAAKDQTLPHIHLLREFDSGLECGKDVPDPWFGDLEDFENVFQISERCCEKLLAHILQQKTAKQDFAGYRESFCA
jgi:protein-tyrosine-phosphatase